MVVHPGTKHFSVSQPSTSRDLNRDAYAALECTNAAGDAPGERGEPKFCNEPD